MSAEVIIAQIADNAVAVVVIRLVWVVCRDAFAHGLQGILRDGELLGGCSLSCLKLVISLDKLRDVDAKQHNDGQHRESHDLLLDAWDRHAVCVCHGLGIARGFGQHVCRRGDCPYGAGNLSGTAQVAHEIVIAVLEQAAGSLRGKHAGDLRGMVLVGLGHRKPALQFLPLFALHSKARRKSAIAKDGEFDYGECDSGIYARGLEFLLVERDIVDHLERQHQQARYERHDECGRCDFGVCAVPLDAFLFLFGELLHGASALIVIRGRCTRTLEYR